MAVHKAVQAPKQTPGIYEKANSDCCDAPLHKIDRGQKYAGRGRYRTYCSNCGYEGPFWKDFNTL